MSKRDLRDGFDLIEYPCEYTFKAMCRAGDEVEQQIKQVVVGQIEEFAIISMSSAYSRSAKFQSVSLTVTIAAREDLERIYHAIAQHPLVVMTL